MSNDHQVTTAEAVDLLANRKLGSKPLGPTRALRVLVRCANKRVLCPSAFYFETADHAAYGAHDWGSAGHHGSLDERDLIPQYFWHTNHENAGSITQSYRAAGIWCDPGESYFQRWEACTYADLPYPWRVRWGDDTASDRFEFDARAYAVLWDREPLDRLPTSTLSSTSRLEPFGPYRYRETVALWQRGLMELLAEVLETGALPGDDSKRDAVDFLRERIPLDDSELYKALRFLDQARAAHRDPQVRNEGAPLS